MLNWYIMLIQHACIFTTFNSQLAYEITVLTVTGYLFRAVSWQWIESTMNTSIVSCLKLHPSDIMDTIHRDKSIVYWVSEHHYTLTLNLDCQQLESDTILTIFISRRNQTPIWWGTSTILYWHYFKLVFSLGERFYCLIKFLLAGIFSNHHSINCCGDIEFCTSLIYEMTSPLLYSVVSRKLKIELYISISNGITCYPSSKDRNLFQYSFYIL